MQEKASQQDLLNKAWQLFVVEDKPPCIEPGVVKDDLEYFPVYQHKGATCPFGAFLPQIDDFLQRRSISAVRDFYPKLIASVFSDDVVRLPDLKLYDLQENLHDRLIDLKLGKWERDFSTPDSRADYYRKLAKLLDLTVPAG